MNKYADKFYDIPALELHDLVILILGFLAGWDQTMQATSSIRVGRLCL